jgi:hypothetical protein
MFKIILVSISLLVLYSCSGNSEKVTQLQNEVNELKKKVDDSYKPGFGEFMSNIQIHHAKLWFAGINQNWDLADFEINEIKESFNDLKKYQTDRVETKMIPMIDVPIDSVNSTIQRKDLKSFKNNFVLLTKTCNECHLANNFEFNRIKIPEAPPFTNQVFAKGNE